MKKLFALFFTVPLILAFASVSALAVDTDGDGMPDDYDNCPYTANPNQRDSDDDGFGNLCDNCPFVPNPTQANADSDDWGDACDPDLVVPPCGEISGNSNEGLYASHIYTLRIPEPVFDTLPEGAGLYYIISSLCSIRDPLGSGSVCSMAILP